MCVHVARGHVACMLGRKARPPTIRTTVPRSLNTCEKPQPLAIAHHSAPQESYLNGFTNISKQGVYYNITAAWAVDREFVYI